MTPPLEQSLSLSTLGSVRHGFFGRLGGMSSGDFAGNNVSVSVGDDPATTRSNRHGCLLALDLADTPLLTVKQVHSNRVQIVTTADGGERIEADALVTTTPNLALGILTADCTPILLADPEARVVGAVHAGWRGAVDGIVGATVDAMVRLGAAPARLVAAIGPTISGPNYEVGTAFAQDVVAHQSGTAPFLFTPPGGKPHFDLPGFVRAELLAAGITSIDMVGSCTYGDPSRYFSHRFATHRGTLTGRQIAIIAIASPGR